MFLQYHFIRRKRLLDPPPHHHVYQLYHYHDHHHHELSSQPVPVIRIKTVPFIFLSGVLSIICLSVFTDRAALGFDIQTRFPNVLVIYFYSLFYYCIDVCYPQFFFLNIFITFMLRRSVSYGRYKESHFCSLHSPHFYF